MNRVVLWLFVIVALASVWLIEQMPDDNLHVIFCDVGQGDGSLVVYKNFQMLIDTGPSPDKILACLANNMPFWDRTLEVVLISHNQRDHAGALEEVKKSYQLRRLIRDGAVAGDSLRYAGLSFNILSPSREKRVLGASSDDANKTATVGELKFGSFRALFTADIGFEEEKELLEEGLLEDVDVLKVGHHGSKYSTQAEFLQALKPEIAVIQVGKNSYGHPTKEVLERLKKMGIKVYRNDKNGEVEIISDGEKIWVSKNL